MGVHCKQYYSEKKPLEIQEVEIMLKILIRGISMHIHLNMTMFLRWYGQYSLGYNEL